MSKRKHTREHEDFMESKVVTPDKGDLFGLVLRRLGGSWLEVSCSDGKIRRVLIPGKMRRTRIYEGDVILVRPWYGMQEDTRGDVLHKYSRSEVRWLLKSRYRDILEKIMPEDLLEEYI